MTADQKSSGWALDAVLSRDTHPVGDLPLCRVLLNRDANYPWLLLVPRRRGTVEIIDLDDADQALLAGETATASRALKAVTGCDKLNVAAIGNVVSQLHVHVIARRRDDAAWPKPVWNAAPPRPYDEGALRTLIAAIGASLPLLPP
jgi:diadenosine tetraphosphate (Ap4A) HIT family hydrolase